MIKVKFIKSALTCTICLIFIHLCNMCFPQNYQWAKSLGSTSFDEGKSITTDASGNVYITGYFSDTVDFDPGVSTANLTSIGSQDVFIAKYDSSGNYIWAKGIGGGGGSSITTDASGNVYVTGQFVDTADFDPGTGTANLTSVGSTDIFFAKYDNSGNYIWAKSIGSVNTDYSSSIKVDVSGNVYITGWFKDTVDFDPGIGTAILTSDGLTDIFFAKYDNSGNYLWAKNIGGPVTFNVGDSGNSINIDELGNIYVAGYFNESVDFDPGIGSAYLTSNGQDDIFFAKYDSSGNYLWAKSIGSSSSDEAKHITTDPSGNVLLSGYFHGTADFNPGAGTANLTSIGLTDLFFAKYDSSGNYLWAKSIGGTLWEQAKYITTDPSGNILLTGYFNDTVDFDPGAGTANLTSIGNQDVFFAKYNSSGNYIWAKGIGSIYDDQCRSIAIDASGNIYITGFFWDTADFDPGVGTANLTSVGGVDIFFAKYSQYGSTSIQYTAYQLDIEINIYPNPFNTYTLIEFKNYKKEKHILTIYNSLGELVRQIDNITTGQIRIERDNLTNGLYFFQLRTDSEIIGKGKVIIE